MKKTDDFITVWGVTEEKQNVELCFCCEIEKKEAVVLELVAKDIYNLFINGRFAAYGPARTAKGYSRIERLEIEEYLTEEENIISVYVQSNNASSLHIAKEEPLFGACIRADGQKIAGTEDFKCYWMTDKLSRVERMSCQRGFVEIYDMKKDREHMGVERFPQLQTKRVQTPQLLERGVSYARNEEQTAELVKQGGVYRNYDLTWENDFTRLLDSGKKLGSYARRECDCVLSKELLAFCFDDAIKEKESQAVCLDDVVKEEEVQSSLYRFSKSCCGKLKLNIKALGRTNVWLTYDDVLVDGNIKFNREQIIHGMKWTLQEGEYTLYSQEIYSAKYVQLILDGEAEITSVSMICIENPDTEGFIPPDMDKELQIIVRAAQNTFKHNAYDIFTDTPSRERAGWLCDSYFMGKAEQFFTGKNIVEKNFLENYLLYENKVFRHKGIIPMCYPAEVRDEEDYIPAWILWYVLELEDYLERTGDEEFLALHRQRIQDILEFFGGYENEYGLLENLEGWVFLEWSEASDYTEGVNFPYNMLYADMLRAAGRLLNEDSLIQKSEALKHTIYNMSYNGKVFIDNAVRTEDKLIRTEHVSELCQTFAMFFQIGCAEHDFCEDFKNHFKSMNHGKGIAPTAMFIGEILRLMVLFEMEEYELLLEECKERFLTMAEKTGTIWEFFEQTASCNHGFGAIVGRLICESVMALQRKKGDLNESI